MASVQNCSLYNSRPTGFGALRLLRAAHLREGDYRPRPHFCLLAMRVAALGPEAVERIIKTIAVIDDFCHANDPYEEHDFGSFEVDGHRIFFKIDYLGQAVTCH